MGWIGVNVLRHPDSHVDQQGINYAGSDMSFSTPSGL